MVPMTRLGKALFGLVAVVALGAAFGYWRAAIAVGMFSIIAILGVRYMRFVMAAPPDPELTDVGSYGFKYVCTMCGLELKVEKAAKDRPPSHCMEPMVLLREDGKPPLHTV